MTLQEVQTFAEYSFGASVCGALVGAVAVEVVYCLIGAARDWWSTR